MDLLTWRIAATSWVDRDLFCDISFSPVLVIVLVILYGIFFASLYFFSPDCTRGNRNYFVSFRTVSHNRQGNVPNHFVQNGIISYNFTQKCPDTLEQSEFGYIIIVPSGMETYFILKYIIFSFI